MNLKQVCVISLAVICLFSCKKEESKPVHRHKYGDSSVKTSGVGEKRYFWPNNSNGRTVLRIKFLESIDQASSTNFMRIAKQWEETANIEFRLVGLHDDAEIRVTFDPAKCGEHADITSDDQGYSELGTMALAQYDQSVATMYYDLLFKSQLEEDYDSIGNSIRHLILHEVGHSLGLRHEGAHPKCDDRELSLSVLVHSENIDVETVMNYNPEKAFLSQSDKDFIGRVYPFPGVSSNYPLVETSSTVNAYVLIDPDNMVTISSTYVANSPLNKCLFIIALDLSKNEIYTIQFNRYSAKGDMNQEFIYQFNSQDEYLDDKLDKIKLKRKSRKGWIVSIYREFEPLLENQKI